jgi:predicted branched-subunit amino acid permease
MRSSPTLEFWDGVRAELPLQIGVVPFGMIFGVLAMAAGIPFGGSLAMSSIIFAGSAQFITTQLYALNTPTLVILLTIFVVNLRHALYSASVAPYLKSLKPAWKWLLAYLLTDEAYAVTILHYQQTDARALSITGEASQPTPASIPDHRHWFFLGSGLTLWAFWQVSTLIGIYLGAVIPDSWSLDFTLALVFIAIIVPALKDRPAWGAAIAAGVVFLFVANLPLKLGLIVASLAGILTGMLLEKPQ